MWSSMSSQYAYHSTPGIEATALVVDLRNFTPNLGAARVDSNGVNEFCTFLAEFHALCLDACSASVPEAVRSAPPFLLWSTGDGVIVCFTDPEAHPQHAFLTALVLHGVLRSLCERYNQTRPAQSGKAIDFGIGVQSGEVWAVHVECPRGGPEVHTYLGPCINVAARAQEVSKTLHRARSIIGSRTNEWLVREFLGKDYGQLVSSTQRRLDDAHHLALEAEMSELNQQLCLAFIHVHILRGVEGPLALFRVSESTARLGNPRFESLLEKLTGGSAAHLAQVRAFLAASS